MQCRTGLNRLRGQTVAMPIHLDENGRIVPVGTLDVVVALLFSHDFLEMQFQVLHGRFARFDVLVVVVVVVVVAMMPLPEQAVDALLVDGAVDGRILVGYRSVRAATKGGIGQPEGVPPFARFRSITHHGYRLISLL